MTVEKLYRYEIVLLSLLVLALPSLEALKTFFWFSYLCVYLLRRFRNLRPAEREDSPSLEGADIDRAGNWRAERRRAQRANRKRQ